MNNEKAEIEEALEKARIILEEDTSLKSLSYKDILDMLFEKDGEKQEAHYAVVAILIASSVQLCSLPEIAANLSKIDCAILIDEYVGYILQSQYNIDLIELLLCSHQQELFDRIVDYVETNLQYKTSDDISHLRSFLSVLDNHRANSKYGEIIKNYADLYVRISKQNEALRLLLSVENNAECDFISELRWLWFRIDYCGAKEAIALLFQQKTVWCTKAGIRFIETSLRYKSEEFIRFFSILQEIFQDNEEYRLILIPVFGSYISRYSQESQYDYYTGSLNCLKSIVNASEEDRFAFLDFLWKYEKNDSELWHIFSQIIGVPFKNKKLFIFESSHCFATKANICPRNSVLNDMFTLFSSNKLLEENSSFFDEMSYPLNILAKKTEEFTIEALEYSKNGEYYHLIFGFKLLKRYGKLECLYPSDENNKPIIQITSSESITILKAALYCYLSDAEELCTFSFGLFPIIERDRSEFIKFCTEEIFENYPDTMAEVATQYLGSDNHLQKEFAESIINLHNELRAKEKQAAEIIDLHPTERHQQIIRKAHYEQNKRRQERAHDHSFFLSRYFPAEKLKYGARVGSIIVGMKEENLYRASPLSTISHRIKLPRKYLEDPVRFYCSRLHFLSEVIKDETDN